MKLNIKLCVTVLVVLIGTAIFYSCKKTETNESKANEDILKRYKEKYKNESQTSTDIVNLKGKGYYGDVNGNKISIVPGQTNRGTGSSCPAFGDSEFEQELVSVTREFTCNVGYRFVIQFKITSEFYPQLSNGSGLPSKGRIKLLNGSSQVYITPTNIVNPVLTIVNNGVVGQNSNGDDLNEFLVTYRSEIVSEATYNSSTAIQSNLSCYTDCIDYATLNIGFSSQQQVAGSQHNSLPCTRIDKAYWTPSSGGTPPSLLGCNPFGSGCFPGGYVYPAKQEIEFLNGSGQWKRFYLHFNGLGQAGTEDVNMINYYDAWYIDVSLSQSQNGLVPGNVQVRYRNNHNVGSNGGPCVSQPSGTYVTETWYIN